jgi:ribosomal protein S16
MEEENYSSYYRFSENGIKKRNIKLWNIINSMKIDANFKEKFYLYVNSLKEVPICYCGNRLKFINMNSGFREFCCKDCMYKSDDIKIKRKLSSIEKWGVDNPSKSSLIKEKVKKTNYDRFGSFYPLQSDDVKQRTKEYFIEKLGVDNPSKLKRVRKKAEKTMMDRWGVKYAMLSDNIKKKTKEYFIEKLGVDNPSKLKRVREKAEKTMMDKWGVKHALQKKEFLEKLQNTNLLKYGVKNFSSSDIYRKKLSLTIFKKNEVLINSEKYTLLNSDNLEFLIRCKSCSQDFKIQRQLWRNRIKNSEDICLVCNPIINGTSKEEKNILNYIKEIYDGEIIENFRMEGKEIDIYLPNLKVGFEYNGLYWHSEINKNRSYHRDKLTFFNSFGIDIIQIWEDDWLYRGDIIKSMILNKLNKSSRLFARNCSVSILSNNILLKEFIEENHIQGFVGSKVKLGLFHKDELVSVMTFGNLRKSLGSSSKDKKWELLRFCNKKGISVVGGASKLFKFFIDNYQVDEVISYSLNSYSNGNLYKKLNFIYLNDTEINYFWCKNGIRYHRFNFRKDKLVKEGEDINKTEVEIMYGRSYFRIFDCGSKKWIFNNNVN